MNKCKELLRRDKESISDVMKLRFHPFIAEKGYGAILEDPMGQKYLDFSAGWGVMNTGYGHPRIVNAVNKQMKKLSFAPTISVINEGSIELAEELKKLTPGDFEKSVWYGHSGSDANEFISKVVPLATGRSRIITFVGSYHGQSMGAYAMSGHPAQSRFIGGGNITKIPYPYCYRCPFGRDEANCEVFCLDYIEKYTFGSVVAPNQVGAIVLEAIQCDGGDVVPCEEFVKGLEILCKKHGILLILDEVKIGLGRTGKMFGFEHFNITPDVVILAKPLGSGQPISAVIGNKALMDAGVGMHLFTTAGNPVACAAAIETINIIRDENLVDNAKNIGEYIIAGLRNLQKKYPVIGDVRGKGLVIGVELIKDIETKEPASDFTSLVVYRAFELGLIIYDAGIESNVLEITPPLIISREQADKGIGIIDQAIGDVLSGKITMDKLEGCTGWSS